eukprot:6677035-Lingulodinium_polyedra.AAC.1
MSATSTAAPTLRRDGSFAAEDILLLEVRARVCRPDFHDEGGVPLELLEAPRVHCLDGAEDGLG